MSLAIIWEPAAETVLLRHWHTAEKIDAAVIRFAQTGEGHVERIGPRYRLRIAGHDVIFRVDEAARTMRIFGVYRLQ